MYIYYGCLGTFCCYMKNASQKCNFIILNVIFTYKSSIIILKIYKLNMMQFNLKMYRFVEVVIFIYLYKIIHI